jgi:hypothetical protein
MVGTMSAAVLNTAVRNDDGWYMEVENKAPPLFELFTHA